MATRQELARQELAKRELERREGGREKLPFLQEIGGALKTGLRRGVEDVRTEVVSPIAAGVSTALFGIPRRVTKAFGAEEEAFPEQRTLTGKATRVAAEVGGLMFGGAAKLATKVGGLIPKVAGGVGLKVAPRVASARRKSVLIRNSLRSAAEGATFGGTQIVGEGEFGETVTQQSVQAGILGLAGLVLGPIGAGFVKGGRAIQKGRAIKKGLKKTTKEVSETAKLRARKKVSDIERTVQSEAKEAKILSGNELKSKIQDTTQSLKENVRILEEGLTAESEIVARQFQEELPRIYRANGKQYELRLDQAANDLISRGEQITFREISNVTDDVIRGMDDALITEGAGREAIQAFKSKYGIRQIGEANRFTRASTGQPVGGAIRSNADDAINLQELVQDIRTVRSSLSTAAQSGAKRFTQEEVAISIFNKSIGDLVKLRSSEFAKLQKEYSPIIEAMKASNRIFKPFKGEFETKTAEGLLRRFGLGKTGAGEESLIRTIQQGSSFSPGVGEITAPLRQKGQQLIAAKERIQPVLNSIKDEVRFLQQSKDKTFAKKLLELQRQKEFVQGDFLVKEGQIENALTKRLTEIGFRKRDIELLLIDKSKSQLLIKRLLFTAAFTAASIGVGGVIGGALGRGGGGGFSE